MRSFYMRIFKNIICIYVLALCCFAYATMIHAIPDHVYVQEGQKLELDKKIPVTLAMSTKPQSVMAQIGERTFQAMKQERAVETCSQLKQGEYTLTCYLFGILPMKEVQVSVVNGKSLYVSGQVVGIYGAAQGVLVLGSGPVETVDGSSAQPAEHIVFPGDYITAVNGKAVTKKEELMERINQYGEQPVVLTLWRGAEQIQVSVEPVEAAEHKGYRLGLWVKDDMAGIGTLTYFDQDGNFGALGHGIGNGQTKDLLRLSDGRLYKAQVLGIKKGVRGTPGELEGVVYYGKDNQIGEVSSNTQIGIYGTLTKNFREEKKNESLFCHTQGFCISIVAVDGCRNITRGCSKTLHLTPGNDGNIVHRPDIQRIAHCHAQKIGIFLIELKRNQIILPQHCLVQKPDDFLRDAQG